MSDLNRAKRFKFQIWTDMLIWGIVHDRGMGVIAFGFGPFNLSIKYR